MIELRGDSLQFSFPDVHPGAKVSIEFQRTLRIPDDEKTYHLPPGLGRFPLRHVDDITQNIPPGWREHGGVMLPMYQSEAMWWNFQPNYVEGRGAYPFAIKVATGKINAVTGEAWENDLHQGPQDYMVSPTQPWLDGYCVEKGTIRQFVAMPLGAGYSAEEQITGQAEHGGVQIVVYPMRRDVFEKRFPKKRREERTRVLYCKMAASAEMGLAPGGKMRQEIYDDPYELDDWERRDCSRCFVHITNSLVWSAVTGSAPPTAPPTARQYTKAGLPWFDYYGGDAKPAEGSKILDGLKSVLNLGKEKGDVPLPENESVTSEKVITIRAGMKKDEVREGQF